MTRQTRCIDCNAQGRETERAAPHPGPRCLECWRLEKKRRSKVAHGNRIEQVFGITSEEYWKLYESQSSRCAICRRSTGARRRLAVDHDHQSMVVRGLLCGPCNKDLIGRYDIEALSRAIKYLEDPPAIGVIGYRIVPSEGDMC